MILIYPHRGTRVSPVAIRAKHGEPWVAVGWAMPTRGSRGWTWVNRGLLRMIIKTSVARSRHVKDEYIYLLTWVGVVCFNIYILKGEHMKTTLLSIAALLLLSQVAPSFYNLVGLRKGINSCDSFVGNCYTTHSDRQYIKGYKKARGIWYYESN